MIHYVIQAMAHCELTVIGHWNAVYKYQINKYKNFAEINSKMFHRGSRTELILDFLVFIGPGPILKVRIILVLVRCGPNLSIFFLLKGSGV